MPTLVNLTQSEASEYLSSLNLATGTEAFRTMAALMRLNQEVFILALSALEQELITLADINTLPAINNTLVERLVYTRLDSTDLRTLQWKYHKEFVPSAINLPNLKSQAIGVPSVYLAAMLFNEWDYIVGANYDFFMKDPTKYYSYIEAHTAYITALQDPAIQALFATFEAVRAGLTSDVVPDREDCPIYSSVSRAFVDAVFLERGKNWSIDATTKCILSGSFESVFPNYFNYFMKEVAYPAMAEKHDDDLLETGLPGVLAILNDHPWEVITAADFLPRYNFLKMARIYLPNAYGVDVVEDIERFDLLKTYLQAAKTALHSLIEIMRETMQLPVERP